MQPVEELIEKLLDGSVSRQELTELFSRWDGEEGEVTAVIQQLLEAQSFAGLSKKENAELIFHNLLAKSKKRARVISIRRWVAAAAVVILMVSGWWFYNLSQVSKPAVTEIAKATDVSAPSSNRAAITLADGRKIYLDSSGNGKLANQDRVEVTKLDDGRITYNLQLTTHNHVLPILYNTLTNPRGSKVIDITLSDGSRVWLNAESSLKYPIAFNGSDRRVEVTGEAYFEVAHDKSKPFIVSKEGMNVTVLGTHFNVNAYDDEQDIKVTLLEGSVKVSRLTTGDSRLIKPGEQIRVKANSPFAIDHSPDLEAVIAWKNGFFQMENTDVPAIMRQLARWYDIKVIYENEIPEGRITGKIPMTTSLANALKRLEYAGIKFRIEGSKLTLF